MPELRRTLEPRNIEVMNDQMAAVLRAKTGAQRLQIADGLFAFARDHIMARLRRDHPDWSEQRVHRETARRLSHGAV